jgi:hypothetical protein
MTQISGTIHKLSDTEQVTEKFQKRDIVITVQDGQFLQYVKIQFCQDYADLLDSFSEGQEVTIDYSLKGRPYQDKFFTNVDGWRIQLAQPAQAAQAAQAAQPAQAAQNLAEVVEPVDFSTHIPPDPKVVVEDDDDLPF